jgi:hypothetical protein
MARKTKMQSANPGNNNFSQPPEMLNRNTHVPSFPIVGIGAKIDIGEKH